MMTRSALTILLALALAGCSSSGGALDATINSLQTLANYAQPTPPGASGCPGLMVVFPIKGEYAVGTLRGELEPTKKACDQYKALKAAAIQKEQDP